MKEELPRRGKTTIAPEVLVTIARLSALSVPGVARLSTAPLAVDRLFQRSAGEGVRLDVRGHSVVVDLHVVIQHDANVREVGRALQAAVTRAIQDMVGMQVLAVNVHIEDVAFPETVARSEST
ncbi:MAG: Asp23/Gls24 family envelope stress response protein [Anaerolineales bacterium]|nr:Asp23/Gls24 family envelope stress response protein [Anaerolineales bacterium]